MITTISELKAATHNPVLADAVEQSPLCYSMREAATLLGTGRTRLINYLQKIDWISSYKEPRKAHLDRGVIRYRKNPVKRLKTDACFRFTPILTGKGLLELNTLLNANTNETLH